MSPYAKRRVGGRRGVLVLVVAGALVAAVVVPSVFARARVAPTNTTAPGIVAPPTIGDTLSVTPGVWSGSPTSFTYQWLRCPASGGAADGSDCTAVTGATSRA